MLAHICSMLQLPAAAALFLHASLGSSLCAQFQAGIELRTRALEKKRAAQPHKEDSSNPLVVRTVCVSGGAQIYQEHCDSDKMSQLQYTSRARLVSDNRRVARMGVAPHSLRPPFAQSRSTIVLWVVGAIVLTGINSTGSQQCCLAGSDCHGLRPP